MEITETYEQWEARVTDQARTRALVEGKQAGKVEGRVEGKVEAAIRLLARRFGPLAPVVEARVRGASLDELDSILDRVITASTVEEAVH